MLNGSPINSTLLNGGAATQAPEPEYVVRGQAFTWALRLLVAGADVTAQLTGTVTVDREEGAAGIASFDLFIAPGAPVTPPDWKGRSVTIDYISTKAGTTIEARRYTGQISRASWNPITRVLSCECSDQLQQRVESMAIASIDALVGGHWSADVLETVEGRSHWDYALERLSTRPASLECSPAGGLRVTSWYAVAPHFVFGPGTTLYQTVDLQEADLDRTVNRVEIEFSYRYSRLWQRNKSYAWKSPETGLNSGIGGFCQWRSNSHELPTKEMIADAAADNGETVLSPNYYDLPPTMADPCLDGNPWINNQQGLLLGVSWIGARRWVQTVTETYRLALATEAGQGEGSRIVQRAGYTLDIDDDRTEEWTSEPILGGDSGYSDTDDEARRDAALTVALHAGQTQIIAAHRETTLTWQVPTSLALGVDLIHTLELADQGAHAIGKCRRIVDRFDLLAGEAITTLSIAVMRGGGASDPLTLPDRIGAQPLPPPSGSTTTLPTQLGGRLSSPEYNEDLPGFAGNYSSTTAGLPVFPRRIDAVTDEIAAEDRDERQLEAERLYRVGIPNDKLEL
ncbi:hypothetical protein [Stutzerimonas nitrititolerans]|uniref:hypothetical protein n=1 Tax=Stutzerimonas nitrititolerans TaxID=2482751 RepID=UPI0028AE9029|nr:hypothetical protein [Stutzerimonas nitrititolerans]